MRLSLSLLLPVLLTFCTLVLLSASPAHAQREDLLRDRDSPCRDNPHTEDCICQDSRARSLQPKPEHLNFSVYPPKPSETKVYTKRNFDGSPDTGSPLHAPSEVFDKTSEGYWYEFNPIPGARVNYDDHLSLHVPDGFYDAACAHDYFEENLTRMWYFLVALGTALLTVSLVWAGVIHMQESATGQRNTALRQTLARVIVGILLLALAFVIWAAVNQEIWGRYISPPSIVLSHLSGLPPAP